MGKAIGAVILTFAVCAFVEVINQAYNLLPAAGIIAALSIIAGILVYYGAKK